MSRESARLQRAGRSVRGISTQPASLMIEALERRQLLSATPQTIAGDTFVCHAAAAGQDFTPTFNISFSQSRTFSLTNPTTGYSASGTYGYTPTPSTNSGKLTMNGSDANGSLSISASLLFRASPLSSSFNFNETQTVSGLTNMTSGSANFTFSSPTSTSPDLKPKVGKSTVPSTTTAGGKGGDVTVDLTNSSAALVNGNATVKLYLSKDGKIDKASTLLATLTKSIKIKSHKIGALTVTIKSFPKKLAAGTYTLLARVTDAAGTASATTGPTIRVKK